MVAPKINMHGKIYLLHDEVERNLQDALDEMIVIRSQGKVAFKNPRKRKDAPDTFYIYEAEKSVRVYKERGKNKSVLVKILLEEYEKGEVSFLKWMETLKPEVVEEVKSTVQEINTEIVEPEIEVSKEMKICPICENEFEPKNSRQIYCSKECSKTSKQVKPIK